MEGRIIKIISNNYTVLTSPNSYVCKSRGRFRNMNITPMVGDIVDFDEKQNYILEIKPRKNYLVRPPVSNVDQVMIITSVKDPEFSTSLLDKLLVIIEFNNIKPIICLTKMDLLNNKEKEIIDKNINYYKKIGYDVYLNTEKEKIKRTFKDKITVFTGQSGVGKSTLLNSLEKTLNIKTDEISKALGRGKHTTRHVELIPLFSGLVADTPGFSALSFTDMNVSDIRDNFIEFNEYRDKCEYKDCMHQNEESCMVKEKVKEEIIIKSRYDNYLKFINKG